MTGRVRSVASDVEVVHHVARDAERLEHVATELGAGRQDHDAGGVARQPQLGGRAQHAFGVDAENSASQNLAAVGHLGSQRGERHQVASRHVERSAPHVAFGAVTGIHPHAVHLRRIGVALRSQHLRHDDTGDRRADDFHRFHLHAERGHQVAELLVGESLEVAIFGEP